jgi:hypothetical protein
MGLNEKTLWLSRNRVYLSVDCADLALLRRGPKGCNDWKEENRKKQAFFGGFRSYKGLYRQILSLKRRTAGLSRPFAKKQNAVVRSED